MPYPRFDRSRLALRPLAERKHDLDLSTVLPLETDVEPLEGEAMECLDRVAQRMASARERGASIVLMMGAHVLRAGVQRHLIDLMERRLISHVAMNGAGPIHDYEFALIGATTESVANYIGTGEFGFWEETGRLNDIARSAVQEGYGLGEAIGRAIAEGDFPHREVSLLSAAYRLGVPVTVHVGIGQDIIHQHPNADGAALGEASYADFLVLARAVENLENGVLLNLGTAVMGPEVFLKALSMARNLARQENRSICRFTTLVGDLAPLEDSSDEPPKSHHHYYFRPLKTLLLRTVADGGESFYVRGDHRSTVPNLHSRALRHL